MLKITPQYEIDEYYKSDALDIDTIKHYLDNGIDNYKSFNYEGITMDSCIKAYLLGNDFNENYIVNNTYENLNISIIDLAKCIYDKIKISSKSIGELKEYKKELEELIIDYNIILLKEKTDIDRIIQVASNYFEDLKQNDGKRIISNNIMNGITCSSKSLSTNPNTFMFCNRSHLEKLENVEAYYRLPVYFNYMNVKCKTLLDVLIVIRHENSGRIKVIESISIKAPKRDISLLVNDKEDYEYILEAGWNYNTIVKYLDLENKDITINQTLLLEDSPGNFKIHFISKDESIVGKMGIPETKYRGKIIQESIPGFSDLVYYHSFRKNQGKNYNKAWKGFNS